MSCVSLRLLALPVAVFVFVPFALAGCLDVENPDPGENEGEAITRVELTFTPEGGGAAIVASFADPENDGDPTIDPITLADGARYALAVTFENQLADPVEDITAEVADEGDEHQVFFYGSAVSGPATGDNAAAVVTHAYADEDENGLPIGLANTIEATSTGSGELKVMLRHLPAEGGVAVKVASTAEDFAADGNAVPGDADVDVTFALTVE
jgi:hypothetical protein